MSRSYKKHPCCKDEGSAKRKRIEKHLSNKKVRNCKLDFPEKSNQFKHVYDSWNIVEFKVIPSYGESIVAGFENASDRNKWERLYMRK